MHPKVRDRDGSWDGAGEEPRSDLRRVVAAVREGRVAKGQGPNGDGPEQRARPLGRVSPAAVWQSEPERYARQASRVGAERPSPAPVLRLSQSIGCVR